MDVLGVKRNLKRGIERGPRWARTIRTTVNGRRPWCDPVASGSLRSFTHSVTSADCFTRMMPSGATIIRLVSGVRSVRFPMTGASRGPIRKNTMALLRERKPGAKLCRLLLLSWTSWSWPGSCIFFLVVCTSGTWCARRSGQGIKNRVRD